MRRNSMRNETISNMSDTILEFFGKKVKKLSIQSGFKKRESKLTGSKFLSALVLGFIHNADASLEDICQLLSKGKLKITKQGLHERLNDSSVTFMELSFKESLRTFKEKSANTIELFKPFSSINILDSSGFCLPERLKNRFKGHGGSASQAGLKMQVLLNYMEGISHLWLTGATKNDQGFENHLSHIEKGGLYLQDLGYFVIDNMKKIQAAGGYFISRFLKKTLVFTKEGKEINLLSKLKKSGLAYECDVCIGKKSRFPVRLVAERVPKEVAEKRIRAEKAYGHRKGYTPSKRSLELMNWSIFVTNVPSTLLTLEQIILAYKLRWQIEIFFKLCKSEAGINKVSGKNYGRILCELYAKLIGVVLLLYLTMPVRWQEYQELSHRKAYVKLRNMASDFFRALKSPNLLKKVLKELLDDFKNFAFKDKRLRRKKTTVQQLMDAVGQEKLCVAV
jgi:Transposase DDE domain